MHNAQDSIKEGYEVTDMNIRVITFFLIGLFVLMFGAVGAIIIVMRGFEESRPSLNQDPRSPLAEAGLQVPDKPHLQDAPVEDRKAIVKANVDQVNSYGRISEDPEMPRVHIPIEKAMERVAAGVAYRQAPSVAQESAPEQ